MAVFHLSFGSLQSDISYLVTAEYPDFEPSPGRQETSQCFPNSVGTRSYLTGTWNKHGLGLEETDQSVEVTGIKRLLKHPGSIFQVLDPDLTRCLLHGDSSLPINTGLMSQIERFREMRNNTY
jgi:hypothetical protein